MVVTALAEPKITGRVLAELAGVSYRQIDYWTRVGLLELTHPTPGYGVHRDYDESEVRVARALGRCSKIGITPSSDLAGAIVVAARAGEPAAYYAGVTVEFDDA